jgi:hypothetical protein
MMNPSRKPVVFRGHLGLGDHIICNGLIRHLAESMNLIVPVKKHNLESVRFMLSDLSHVQVRPFLDDDDCDRYCRAMERTGIRVIWNGDLGPASKLWERSTRNFDEKFYEQLGVDFSLRWDKFSIPERPSDWRQLFWKQFPGEEPGEFAFMHNVSSRGPRKIDEGLIRRKLVFWPDMAFTKNIFDYVGVLRHAAEVHCINSSFLCLADSLDLKAELHYHAFPRDAFSSQTLRSNWTVHQYS